MRWMTRRALSGRPCWQEQLNKNYGKFKDACPGITSPNQGVKLALVDLGGLRALPQMMLPPDSARAEPTSPVLRKAGGFFRTGTRPTLNLSRFQGGYSEQALDQR